MVKVTMKPIVQSMGTRSGCGPVHGEQPVDLRPGQDRNDHGRDAEERIHARPDPMVKKWCSHDVNKMVITSVAYTMET
jgi:hypothetical protein